MELATVEISNTPAEIAALVEKYDHPMMPVFRAIGDGQTVIDIQETFSKGGLNEQGLPRLAFSWRTTARYWHGRDGGEHHSISTDLVFPDGALRLARQWRSTRVDVQADCPPIPKNVTALRRGRDIYCWEVDHWEATPRQQLGDPVLLRPLHDRFYTVIAQWDLTPLERELFAAALPE